jgi:hypothetical protein
VEGRIKEITSLVNWGGLLNTCLLAGRELQEAQVSNLRGDVANWKQRKPIRIREAGNIKNKTGEIGCLSAGISSQDKL